MDLKEFFEVMLCQKSEPIDENGFIYEPKLDGSRTVFLIDKKNNYFRIQNRDSYDLTDRFPEFHNLGFLDDRIKSIVLDGELVLNDGKREDYHNPNFKTRIHIQSKLRAKFLSKLTPLTYVVFDVVYANGDDLRNQPLFIRKKILKDFVKETDRVKIIKFVENDGKEFYKDILKKGFEGMIAKKENSVYENQRSYSWLKVKPTKKMVVSVLDYKETSGWGSFGALITPHGDVSFNSETERQEYFRRKKLGEVKIEVRYQEMIPKSKKFRFPKFNKFI
ncbi:MAG: hypothetical protein ACE5K4_11000 [Candidatus Hydrothermarchaeota archaeon]